MAEKSGLTVLNETCAQGEPAYFQITGAYASVDAYSVTTYETISLFEDFAGIVVCDSYGNTTINANTAYNITAESTGTMYEGWIMTRGVCYAMCSGEGTAIAVGDVLGGNLAINANSAHTLARSRAQYTSASALDRTGTGSMEVVVLKSPVALQALANTGGKALIPVWLK